MEGTKKPKTSALTVERARELLRVVEPQDPETESGLVWRVSRGNTAAGSVAGSITYRNPKAKHRRHWTVFVDYVLYRAHRVVFLIEHGRWPDGIIDHRDRNGLNNSVVNLRESTLQQNAWNRSPGTMNKSGVIGVTKIKGDRWQASIEVDAKRISLGRFDDKDEAIAARVEAERLYFGEFAPSLVPSLDDMTGGGNGA